MSDTKTLYSEGEKLKDQGDFAGAAQKFSAVLEENPEHVLAHLALAVTYGNLGQYAESVQHAEKACELEPTDSFNFTALSVTYQKAFEGTRDPIYIQKAESAKARSDMGQGGFH